MTTVNRLPRDFFLRHVVDVAKDLVGKSLVFGHHIGIITETEAYGGNEDPASHAYRGITPRTQVMFGDAGFSYVYFIYGMYHCLNVVTGPVGSAAAVLIRGLRVDSLHLNGPGKLCRHLAITKQHNGIDLTQTPDFYLADTLLQPKVNITPRIGIKAATDWPWRFVLAET